MLFKINNNITNLPLWEQLFRKNKLHNYILSIIYHISFIYEIGKVIFLYLISIV